jgi:two-component system, OmpR family, response regulator MtrA
MGIVDFRAPVGSETETPVVILIARDVADRMRLARLLDGVGVVLICPDIETARWALAAPGPVPVPATVEITAAATTVDTVDTEGLDGRDVVALDELVVDRLRQQATWADRDLGLSYLQREVLACLASTPAEVWQYSRLHRQVWQTDYLGDPSGVHSAVKRLRRRLVDAGVDLNVEAVRGVGFRLRGRPAPCRGLTSVAR